MREWKWLSFVGAAALVFGVTKQASATTEGPSFFDARSVGLGSTGVAYIHNGASLYHNPATLHEIKEFAGTVVLSPAIPVFTTPIKGPNTSVKSDANIAPFFLAGGAYRLNDRLVAGLGIFGTGGFGGSYGNLGKVTLGTLELAPALAFALTDRLSIGAEYRISYLMQHVETPIPGLGKATTDMNGFNFLGAQLGLYYRPIDALRLGFSYRTKVTTSVDGDSESPMGKFDAKSKFSSPHHIKFGAAYEAVQDKLLLVADFRYLFHSEANKEIVTEFSGGRAPNTQRLDWENAFVLGAGAEYNVTERVPVRIGYSLTKTATPEDNASFFFLPPGLVHAIHLGTGVRLENLDLDVGGYYAHGSHDSPGSPVPGTYALDFYVMSLSATYHM